MTYEADPRVDAYIEALPEWQQQICRRVRDLVRAADPEVVETINLTATTCLRRGDGPRRAGLRMPAWVALDLHLVAETTS